MKNAAHFCIVAATTVLLLVVGKSIIIPFVFAFLFWFITREVRLGINKVPFIKSYFPNWLKNTLVFIVLVVLFGFVSEILTNNITKLTNSYTEYQPNVERIVEKLGAVLHVDLVETIKGFFEKFDYAGILSGIANSLSGILGNAFMIVIYALFLFLEERSFRKKMVKMFSNPENYKRTNSILTKIEDSISNYLKLKTYVSLLTGFLSFIVLLLVGVDYAIFWAFLIFLLNYIPTVGSLIATIFPAIFSLIQFGEFTPFLIVLVAVGAVQVVVGNLVEPRVFGKSLNLSPLVTILGLALWGSIWGITGMILSVPITVAMMIAFSQFKSTRPVAMLLSGNGDIDDIA